MSPADDQPQGVTSRSSGARHWFNNLSRQGQIGSIIATLAALVSIVGVTLEVSKACQGPNPSAQLQNFALERNIPQEDYLQQIGKPLKGYSAKRLQELGVLVTVGADLEGLRGDKLTLKYTVHDATDDSRIDELANKEAEEFVPDSSRYDRDFVVFVPYPPRAGEYYVSLSLHDESGVQLDQMDTEKYFSGFAGPQPAEDPVTILESLYDTDAMQPEQGGLAQRFVDAGGLQLQVPSEWNEKSTGEWHVEQLGDIGTELSVSPDLVNGEISLEGGETPGAFLGVSRYLMLQPPEWNYLKKYEKDEGYRRDCQLEGRHNYIGPRKIYEGHYYLWKKCNDTDAAMVSLVAWNRYDPSYLTSARIYVTGEADIEAAKAVLATFTVLDPPPAQIGSQPPKPKTTAAPDTTMSQPPKPKTTAAPDTTMSQPPKPKTTAAPDTTMSQPPKPKTTAAPDTTMSQPPKPSGGASNERASVEDAVRGHYEAIGAGDFEEAYSYLGPTYRKMIDYNKQTWIDRQESEQITDSTINSVNVQRVSENKATATVDVAFQEKGKDSRFFLEWILVKDGGEWKLDEQPAGERM